MLFRSSVTICLEDEIDISRGDMLTGGNVEPNQARSYEATVVWFDTRPLDTTRDYLVKHTSFTVPARVDKVKHKITVNNLQNESAQQLAMNEIGVVRVTTSKPLFFDRYADNRTTGSFVLIDRETNATAGAGMILDAAEEGSESPADRLARLVRRLEPSGLNLPHDDDDAVTILGKALASLIRK